MSNSAPASLTSALLARKGHAVPAAFSAPGPFGAGLAAKTTISLLSPAEPAVAPRPVAAATPETVPPPIGATAPAFVAEARAGSAAETALRSRIRMTLRTRPDLHYKVKLSARHLHRSMNDLITEAVTRYVDQLGPEVLTQDWVHASLADRNPQS